MPFVHLHLHTIYSFLDGLVKPAELKENLKKMGMKAVAITDHGNMHGVIDFYSTMVGKGKKFNDADIKPIIGMEAYISAGDRTEKTKQDAYHIILLAKDLTGYRNLCYMASKAFIDGFYYKPRIDRVLLKEHSQGLIALSACLGGEIPKALLGGRYEEAKKIALEYQKLFGKDDFYIEIQVNGLRDQEEVNPALIRLSREIGAGLAATNDVHYLLPEHAEAQDILFCINEKKKVEDSDRMHHDSCDFYLKSESEMRKLFSVYGEAGVEAIENTGKIAEKCNVELTLNVPHLPDFETEGMTEAEFLSNLARKGLSERFEELGIKEERRQEYYDRLDYELKMIEKTGFSGYFLIVSDFIRWAKDNNIPVGPGRGSGAGSLVAYATKITDLDPIRFGLVFERFLNLERISMPDFDVDFCQDKREKVIEYVSKKYGEKNVAQIATFGQLKAKSAVRDVARALNISLSTADMLAKIVPDSFSELLSPQFCKKTASVTADMAEKYNIPAEVVNDPDKLKAALNNIPLESSDAACIKMLQTEIEAYAGERALIKNNDDFKKILRIAPQIEGLLRQPGKHACGIVIGQKPIFEYSPIFIDKDDYRVTQYDKNMVELVGLVKFDFLGLKTLTMINDAAELVKEKDSSFNISNIPLEDAATYRFLCEKSTKGVFQMESAGFEKMIHQMKPDRIEDLIAAVALYRPGPMDIIPNYIRRKHGLEEIKYEHPWLEDILAETFGLIVYQEQVMQISRKMAGFSMSRADNLRKAMGKKIISEMEKMKVEFLDGADKLDIEKEVAGRVFDHMEKFASYGFNKSHAACYGYISYQTAFLKTHHPVEFFTALISSESSNSDKVFAYINDARSMGINIYSPDINKSGYSFRIEENSIRFGLGAIKNVGEGAIDLIIAEREQNGPFKSLIDFTSRVNQSKVNARTVEFLIYSGAFDFTGINRGELISMLPHALKEGEKAAADKESGQVSLFDAFNFSGDQCRTCDSDESILEMVENRAPIDVFEALEHEKAVLGIYLSNHPSRLFKKDFTALGMTDIKEIIDEVESGRKYYGQKSPHIWVPGIITTEVKPQKGREGEYYLKGVIESYNAAIEFAINRIENPLADNTVVKLTSKVPVVFKSKVRIYRNRDDNTIEKISLNIENIKSDVMTLDEYIFESRRSSDNFNIRLMVETTEEMFVKEKEFIKRKMFNMNIPGMRMVVVMRIFHNETDYSLFEGKGNVDICKMDELKNVFGSDKIYLAGRLK